MTGFPPSTRLRGARDFAALRQRAKRVQVRHFSLRWVPSPVGACRLGLAVSRRVSKRAVVRNRIKRTIRESFRARRRRLPAADVLVIARNSAALAGNSALRRDLDVAWRKLQTVEPIIVPRKIGG